MIAASPARATGECLRRWTTHTDLLMNCCHHRALSRDDMQLRDQLHDQVKEVLYDSEQLGHDLDLVEDFYSAHLHHTLELVMLG